MTSCGLVVRSEEAQPIDDAAELGAAPSNAVVVAPTLPTTTIWTEPDVLPSVPDPAAVTPGETTATTEPPDPWCGAFANFINVGTEFTLLQGQASREQLVAALTSVRDAARALIPLSPPEFAENTSRLAALLATTLDDVNAMSDTAAVLQRIGERVGGITPLVDPLIAGAPEKCADFRGPDEPTSAQFGYDALSGKG